EHQHGGSVAHRTHAPADLEAVDSGHHHIENYRVRAPGCQPATRLTAVARSGYLEAVEAQHQLQCLPYRGVVIDDQQAHRQILTGKAERKLNRTSVRAQREDGPPATWQRVSGSGRYDRIGESAQDHRRACSSAIALVLLARSARGAAIGG